jgi:hypothetical protein
MNRKHQFMGVGAATAAAAILATVTVYGLSSLNELNKTPATDELATASPTTASGDSSRLLTWIDTSTMPMLNDSTAVRDSGVQRFKLTRPRLLLNAMHQSVLEADNCHSHWRPLVTGPEGREVTNICPGSPLLPMPHENLKLQRKSQLPRLALFNSVFENRELASNYLPSSSNAEQAADTVVHTLQSRGQQEGLAEAQAQNSAVEPAPFVDPLGWSVAPNALRAPKATSHAVASHIAVRQSVRSS